MDLQTRIKQLSYELAAGKDFNEFWTRNQQTITNFINHNSLSDRRQLNNCHEKQLLRMNVERYVKGFYLSHQTDNQDYAYRYVEYFVDVLGLTLNTAAFLNTIELLGDDQQASYWRDQIMNAKAFGGYMQTELGHGSNVQGLETTAKYDEHKHVFILNSPTVTSAKFWPGVLGMFSTHALMQAQTYIKDKSIGIQTFVVEIRNTEMNLLKGVRAGDIGPKLGFQKVDNGYLLLDHYQVPRKSMLMRYVQVTPAGEVKGLQNKQAIKYGYGSMLYLRVKLVYVFAFGSILQPVKNLHYLQESMGIAQEAQNRKSIIEYMSIGHGLVLSNYYAQSIYDQFSQELKAQNYSKADQLLIDCHIISSTYKALASWKSVSVLQDVMSSNRYAKFRTTSLPKYFCNAIPSATYEGDNSVLMQQTAKYLLGKYQVLTSEKKVKKFRDDDMQAAFHAFEYVSDRQIQRLRGMLSKGMEDGLTINACWNEKYQRDIIDVSRLWGTMMLMKGSLLVLEKLELKDEYTKILKVYFKNLIETTPTLFLYGFQIESTESWKQFTEQELKAFIYLNRPAEIQLQQHKLISRLMKQPISKL